MTMTTFSLLAAIGWAVVVAGAVAAASRVRLARARSRPPAGVLNESRPGPRVTTADLVVGGLAGLATFGAILLGVHLTVRFTVFGSIAMTYLLLVVGVPLAMVGVLVGGAVARWRRGAEPRSRLASRPALVVCAGGLLLAPVGIYATHIEPSMLEVDRPAPLGVDGSRAGEQTITVGVMTDLQTLTIGDRERWAVDELMAARPDVIVLPGDIIQGDDDTFERQLPALRELLGRLSAPGGVYLVGGDVDKPLARLPEMVEGTAVRYLADEVVTTTVGDRTVTIGGLGVDYRSSAARAVVDRLETESGDDDIRILVAHRPDPVLELREDSRIDLQVSGHTHGGQVALPFVGPLMTLSHVPRDIAGGGLHELRGNAIYVGHGVGLERGSAPQVRFGVRPDIGVLTLTG